MSQMSYNCKNVMSFKMRASFFTQFWYTIIVKYRTFFRITCSPYLKKSQQWYRLSLFSFSLQNKKLHSLIRQLNATMNYCLNLLTIELTINCYLFILFLHRKKGLPLYAAFKRDWSIVWILWYESILSLVIHFPYSTQRESGRYGMVHLGIFGDIRCICFPADLQK